MVGWFLKFLFSQGGKWDMASIQEKVYEIIERKLSVNPEQITPEASFTEDLGADSLDTVELVMDLEEVFNITIPEEDQEKLRTVQEAIDYLEANVEA
jgi:acyl carrier protein